MSKSIVGISALNTNEQIVEMAVLEFGGFVRKTAENVIEMGRIVYETKQKLKKDKGTFELFCSRLGFNSKSKSIVKLGQIGKLHYLLKNHTDSLPESWTTLYEITLLGEKKIAEFIEEGVIHRFVLGSEIKKLAGTKVITESKEENLSTVKKEEIVLKRVLNGYSFLCEMDEVTDVALKSRLRTILNDLKELKVKVKYSSDLKSALRTELLKAA